MFADPIVASIDLIPRCLIVVDFEPGSYDRETWFNIYAGGFAGKDDIPRHSIPRFASFSNGRPAGVAANVMCVQNGFAGRAINIGRLNLAHSQKKGSSKGISINVLQVAIKELRSR